MVHRAPQRYRTAHSNDPRLTQHEGRCMSRRRRYAHVVERDLVTRQPVLERCKITQQRIDADSQGVVGAAYKRAACLFDAAGE